MLKTPKFQVAVILLVLGLGFAAYLYWSSDLKTAAPGPQAAHEQVPPPSEPEIKYPVEMVDGEKASTTEAKTPAKEKPQAEAEEVSFFDELSGLLGKDLCEALLNSQELIRHFVVTVENSSGRQLPQQFSPFKPFESSFMVLGEGENLTIDPHNADRYAAIIGLIQNADLASVLSLYRRYYPLFQSAYHELGVKGYFNDRLVQVIDSVLETPSELGPTKVVLEGNHYKFADSRLEALSGAQKVLIRVGPENERILKNRLREIRQKLTRSRGG